jgi:hypothetical protein
MQTTIANTTYAINPALQLLGIEKINKGACSHLFILS